MVCPGCGEIHDAHDGLAEHCDHCFMHGLCEAGRTRSSQLARLLHARPAQRDWFMPRLERTKASALRNVVQRMFHYLPPVERTVLLEVFAEEADIKPFRDARRSCR